MLTKASVKYRIGLLARYPHVPQVMIFGAFQLLGLAKGGFQTDQPIEGIENGGRCCCGCCGCC